MTSISLNTGLRALLSARYVLDTIGHNVANANTPGYSRQRVDLTATLPLPIRGLLIGSGVGAESIQRSVDALLGRRITQQQGISGALESQLGSLTELESLFGEPGEGGLGNVLDNFFTGISDLSAGPDDPILRTNTVQKAVTMTDRFRVLANGLGGLVRDTESELETRVDEANALARRVAELNLRIGEAEAGGLPANDLRDGRDQAVKQLSRLLNVQAIEDPSGAVRVQVAGNTLVTAARANTLEVERTQTNKLELRIEGAQGTVPIQGGAIGGLLELSQQFVPGLSNDLDRLARNLILEMNRIHSTGIPATGAFSVLTGENGVQDVDGDGQLGDELLSRAGLPFEVTSGSLYVNVSDEETGSVRQHRIAISETHTTVQGFLAELNAIPDLSADLDAFGRLRIVAQGGHRFDFSRRLDANPDESGTFGGAVASLGTAEGPFAFVNGDTLQITVDPGGSPVVIPITFQTSDFAEISQAEAEEIAAVINAEPAVQANGMVASVVGGALYLQTVGGGSEVDFSVSGGSSVAALGWSGQVGTPITGHDLDVDVEVGGVYTGKGDGVYTFVPRSDGVIGTTAGLLVDVLDDTGKTVATLEVGAGYQPGTELRVAEGVTVSFGLGELSATDNDRFDLQLVEDSDTADVLVALGVNSLLVGGDASDIALRQDIRADPAQLASSISGEPGDASLLLELLDSQAMRAEGLDDGSFGGFYGRIIGDLGFQAATVEDALIANESLVTSLELRRDQVSGVNIDEELVDMLQYEQAFSAAAQFITVVNQLNDELLSLI